MICYIASLDTFYWNGNERKILKYLQIAFVWLFVFSSILLLWVLCMCILRIQCANRISILKIWCFSCIYPHSFHFISFSYSILMEFLIFYSTKLFPRRFCDEFLAFTRSFQSIGLFLLFYYHIICGNRN